MALRGSAVRIRIAPFHETRSIQWVSSLGFVTTPSAAAVTAWASTDWIPTACSPKRRMLKLAFKSRSIVSPQVQTCTRSDNFFSTRMPHLLHLLEVLRGDGGCRGEAACLVLAQRDAGTAVLLSSDEIACQAAQALGISFLTIPDILTQWIYNTQPSPSVFQELIEGMRSARFTLPESVLTTLQSRLLNTN